MMVRSQTYSSIGNWVLGKLFKFPEPTEAELDIEDKMLHEAAVCVGDSWACCRPETW